MINSKKKKKKKLENVDHFTLSTGLKELQKTKTLEII